MSPSGHIHGHSHPFILLASKMPPTLSYSLIPLRKKNKLYHKYWYSPQFYPWAIFSPHTNVLVPSVFSLITCKSVISDLMQITCLKRNNLSLFTEPRYSSVWGKTSKNEEVEGQQPAEEEQGYSARSFFFSLWRCQSRKHGIVSVNSSFRLSEGKRKAKFRRFKKVCYVAF